MSNQLEKEFEAENSFSNQHQDDTKPHSTEDYNGSDQDSSKSKEVVKHDRRKRHDGPGGN